MANIPWSKMLRDEVATLNKHHLAAQPARAYQSLGASPTIMFQPCNNGTQHGNFCDASYAAILTNPAWKKRLDKPHPRKDALPPSHQNSACELDSSNSSDALLMNIFCYPDVLHSPLADLLKIPSTSSIEFGYKATIPLVGGQTDTSEIDLKVNLQSKLLVEAKFTEADFTLVPEVRVRTYRDLDDVFDVNYLPRQGGDFESYQLIRNVLAAHHHECRFLLFCDARRPDLLQAWWRVYGAIKSPQLRARCGFVLWQQMARVVPKPLSDYLAQSRAI